MMLGKTLPAIFFQKESRPVLAKTVTVVWSGYIRKLIMLETFHNATVYCLQDNVVLILFHI